MKAGIIVFPGTNCDRDTFMAAEHCGWKPKYIWHDETNLSNFDLIFLPGGFSYGDYIRAGRLAKFSPAVFALNDYIDKNVGVVVGICNGFQILCERKLLPGILSVNEKGRFICDIVDLETNIKDLPEEIRLPIAHAEGCYLADKATLEYIEENDMVFLTYKKNPNGSTRNIAGLIDKKRKIIGLMPHPERAMFNEIALTDGQIFFKFLETLIES